MLIVQVTKLIMQLSFSLVKIIYIERHIKGEHQGEIHLALQSGL